MLENQHPKKSTDTYQKRPNKSLLSLDTGLGKDSIEWQKIYRSYQINSRQPAWKNLSSVGEKMLVEG